jgi:L,D-transpeptidase YcbB
MKRISIFFLFLFFLLNACTEDKKEEKTKAQKSKILSIFKSKIGTENIDSLIIENFIASRKEFEPFKGKIHNFYHKRNYGLAWSDKGEFLPQADMFINLIYNIQSDGINSYQDYELRKKFRETNEAIRPKRKKIAERRKYLDLFLTSLYFQYSKDIWQGTIDPEIEQIEWHIDRKKIKFENILDSILNTNSKNPFQDFEILPPAYQKLKILLEAYKKIDQQGGWPTIKMGGVKKLQIGDTSELIPLLRKRLLISGDLKGNSNDSIFDKELKNSMKKFQKRHGLKEDGILTAKSLKVLNVSVKERIEQIIVNMERWRWVPQINSPNYVMVNIPEFKLHVIEKEKEIFPINVIVGKVASTTPIFNDEIEYIVINPTWHVPNTIGTNEIIPLIKEDSLYLEEQNMEVLKNNQLIDPSSIDWNTVDDSNADEYSFRQKPGKGNALGRIKFVFPNEYDVYLHDTPGGQLFNEAERDFSHGCIRIQEPLKFVAYLLKDDPNWSKEKIKNALKTDEEQFIKLKKKVPIYIVYFTAWLDNEGIPNFREDIYEHDKKLESVYFE